jgi:hypothetical protein
MKRSGFKRPQIEHKRSMPEAIPVHLRRNAVFARCDVPAAPPVEKDNPIQHEGYMRLVRQLPCARCGKPGPSQFCHSDEGKGAGIKSDCRLGWPGCGPAPGYKGCHYLIGTERIYHKEQRRQIEAEMARRTRHQIESMGLWPANLPQWREK